MTNKSREKWNEIPFSCQQPTMSKDDKRKQRHFSQVIACCHFTYCNYSIKQGVALTGRNHTGPPCSVTMEQQLDWRRHDVIAWPAWLKPTADQPWSVTDDDYRCPQTPANKTKQYWPIRRAGGPVINIQSRLQQTRHSTRSCLLSGKVLDVMMALLLHSFCELSLGSWQAITYTPHSHSTRWPKTTGHSLSHISQGRCSDRVEVWWDNDDFIKNLLTILSVKEFWTTCHFMYYNTAQSCCHLFLRCRVNKCDTVGVSGLVWSRHLISI